MQAAESITAKTDERMGATDALVKFATGLRYDAIPDAVRHAARRHSLDTVGAILACYDPKADGDEDGPWRHHPHQYTCFAVKDLETTRADCAGVGATT